MSFGMRWTDDELAAGVHHLFGSRQLTSAEHFDEQARIRALAGRAGDETSPDEWQPKFDEAGAQLLVSQLPTTSQIRIALCHYILESEKEQLVDRYARRERLPTEFKAAAMRPDALPVLIKSFLAKFLALYPSPGVHTEILDLSSRAIQNDMRRTAYDRVGDIQKYIHNKADALWGPDGHAELPSKAMQYLLSSCRLHISLQDLFGSSAAYWETIWDAEISASAQEAESPRAGFVPAGKRHIENWRVRHKQPLTHYATPKTRGVLRALGDISLELPLAEYRATALAALAGRQLSAIERLLLRSRSR